MQQVLARKNVQKTTFEVAEVILGPWNQQTLNLSNNWVQKLDRVSMPQDQHNKNLSNEVLVRIFFANR